MSSNGQEITFWRGEDVSLVLTGADGTNPTGWGFVFSLGMKLGQAPLFTTTAVTVGGTGPFTLTVGLTRAQTSELTNGQYWWDLFRTDPGSNVRLAGGIVRVLTPARPPA